VTQGLVIDLFAGGGGASTGIEAALGRPVDIAINHDRVALAVHAANHPRTAHLASDIWETRPLEATRGRPVDLIWASPDCTHHSVAKGAQPRRQDIRSLADAIVPWLRDTRASYLFLENVREFESWGPLDADGRPIKARRGEDFDRWTSQIRALGYRVEHRVLDASHYGAPTRRRRLFLVARRDGRAIAWPRPTHGPGLAPFRTAAECIDWSRPCPSIFERDRPLAEKTLWRIAQGLLRFVFNNPRPFILQVNHGRWEPRHEDIAEPLSTVTASQRGHALVVPTLQQSGYGERDGQRARALQLDLPLGTVMAKGQKHALIAAFLSRYFGDPNRTDGGGGVVIGQELAAPLPTVTVRDHHALAAVTLAKFHGTDMVSNQSVSADVCEPLPTITAGSNGSVHVAEVRAFLTAYYGSDGTGGQLLTEPMRTLTAKARLGLVTVDGVDYQVADIGFRMLEPDELLRAQFGEYAADYDLSLATTKKDQLRLIGNSVCPDVAAALVRANLPQEEREAA
jgi:DNA (cytosine-5)-methyltransferase 1